MFDRIREFTGIYSGKTKKEVVNMAVNSTVSRTIITSLTTLFVVAILFAFGGSSIRGFAFALVIGIIVGTYSSIFVATPVMTDLTKRYQAEGHQEVFRIILEGGKRPIGISPCDFVSGRCISELLAAFSRERRRDTVV